MVATLLVPFGSAHRLLACVPLLATLVAVGCAGSGESRDEAIDRQVFIDAWVDLRIAALDTDSQRIAAPDRAAILARHGISADDLTHFAEVHAADLEFMRGVWSDVELRLDRPTG